MIASRSPHPFTSPGLLARTSLDLSAYVDLDALAALDDEICLALTRLPVEYTGGSHKWMGIVPPSLEDEPYLDYGQVIAGFTREDAAAFLALASEPEEYDLDHFAEYEWGEERDNPLSRDQVLWLKFKHGVYFPWKTFVEMIPTSGWEDKAHGSGKTWTAEAREHFPGLIALVEDVAVSRDRPLQPARPRGQRSRHRPPRRRAGRGAGSLQSPCARAATSGSSCGTRRSNGSTSCAGARTGSTTTNTMASRPTRSSATRSGWTGSSSRPSSPASSVTCARSEPCWRSPRDTRDRAE